MDSRESALLADTEKNFTFLPEPIKTGVRTMLRAPFFVSESLRTWCLFGQKRGGDVWGATYDVCRSVPKRPRLTKQAKQGAIHETEQTKHRQQGTALRLRQLGQAGDTHPKARQHKKNLGLQGAYDGKLEEYGLKRDVKRVWSIAE